MIEVREQLGNSFSLQGNALGAFSLILVYEHSYIIQLHVRGSLVQKSMLQRQQVIPALHALLALYSCTEPILEDQIERGLDSAEKFNRERAKLQQRPGQHRVTLSTGRVLLIEEGDERLHIASETQGHPYDVNMYVCQISADGVLVMPNSGDDPAYLTRGLKKGGSECPAP